MLCFLYRPIYAQQYNFINYNVEDGLAQSQVFDICQDDLGYLWIGTASGLSRYNGIDFKNYSIDNGLPDNNVRSLFKDDNGVIWIATATGLAKFENQTFTKFIFNEQYRVNEIISFQNRLYLATTTGLVAFENNQFVNINSVEEENDAYFFRAIVNYKNEFLICGGKEGLFKYDGVRFEEYLSENFASHNIMDLKLFDDKLFIGARKAGIVSYDFLTKIADTLNIEAPKIRSFIINENDFFGIETNAGAFFTESNGMTNYFSNNNGLVSNNLTCVFKDNENNFWLGTDGKGLLKFSGTSIVSYTTKDNLSSDLVLSINQDQDNTFIYGTYDAGIIKKSSKNEFSYFDGKDLLADNTVWSIKVDDKNNTWLGTSSGLTILDENDKVVKHPFYGENHKIRAIHFTESGKTLLGGDDGLAVLTDSTVTMLHPTLNINKIVETKGWVFIGAFNGLYQLDKKDLTGIVPVPLPENTINTLEVDIYDNLWIGTSNGLFIYTKTGKLLRFPFDNSEYRSKTILGLLSSSNGNIWISTLNGVYEIERDTEKEIGFRVYNYGAAEGLVNMECNINALYEDNKGNIWIGTSAGLARINPALNSILFDYKSPKMHIIGMRLFMEDFNYLAYEVEMDSIFDVPLAIVLPYDKNHLTFDFIGINLKDPKAVKYEYRMIGTNEDWSPISTSNYATYSFLNPGKYTFEVRAINKNRLWSAIRKVKIEILPPFWETWWFIFLVVALSILLLGFIFQTRINTIKQKQENEQLGLRNRLLFLEQRSLNASMNRHFIFNSLNSIQYYINSSDKRSANRYLSSFAKLIRMNLDSSAANNFIVTLQEEVDRIELYLSLEKMRFTDKFNYEINISPEIDLESIEIPSMILQPFVENSIIHGVLSIEEKGLITIDINEEMGEVVFVIQDNGIGIDNSVKLKRKTIEGDHESKGVEITNRRIELLRELTGEDLMIIGPFQLDREDGTAKGTKVILKLGGAKKF